MKKRSLELSKEEKDKRMTKRGRQVRRKSQMPKSTSTNTLYHKIGKLKFRLDEFEKIFDESILLMEDSVADLLVRMERILTLPIIVEAIKEQEEIERLRAAAIQAQEGKEECPTCHKFYKQLKKHKCKNV